MLTAFQTSELAEAAKPTLPAAGMVVETTVAGSIPETDLLRSLEGADRSPGPPIQIFQFDWKICLRPTEPWIGPGRGHRRQPSDGGRRDAPRGRDQCPRRLPGAVRKRDRSCEARSSFTGRRPAEVDGDGWPSSDRVTREAAAGPNSRLHPAGVAEMVPEAPGACWRASQRQDGSPVLPVDTFQPARSQGHYGKSVYLAARRRYSAASPRHRARHMLPRRTAWLPGRAVRRDGTRCGSRPHGSGPAGTAADRLKNSPKPGRFR